MGTLAEHNVSYWIDTTEETPQYPRYVADAKVDVAVVGAGLTGLITAALLQRDGRSVAVIEAGRIASGVTANTTAKVTSLHGLTYAKVAKKHGQDAARTYAEANQRAIELIEELAQEHGIDCWFERMAACTYAVDEEGAKDVEEERDAAQAAGLPVELTTDPGLPFPVRAALRLDNQAQFHPRRFCTGLAAAIVEAGAQVFEHSTVSTVDEVNAEHVVLATQLPFVHRGLLYAKTAPYRSYAIAVTIEDVAPDGMYLSAGEPTRSLRPIRRGGQELIVGGEGHKVGQEEDTEGHYQRLEAWARDHFRVREVHHRWSAHDYVPADGVPYIGPVADRLYVATGFKKWGMTHAAVAAMIITDRVAGRDNPWATLYDATRADPRASAADFVKENLNVAQRLVGDRLHRLTARGVDTLALGEGAIAKKDGKAVAAFRDESGRLHAMSPTCTHLGCTVAWNDAERSWDCPCHGSRFTVDGEVIQGPATKDLTPD